jgi:hypothetical protein
VGDLPDWDEVRTTMLAPKPALSCTAYGLGKPHPVRVAHDGHGGWTLDDGQGGSPAPLSWARSAVDPARYANLASARGDVLRREREGARDAIVVDVHELRRPGGPPLRCWVDEVTGAILRMERVDDPAPIVMLLDLREEG